jgi:activating signal cointegrator complex subunit 3
MIDVCAERGWLATTLQTQLIMQMVIQARWVQDSSLLTLPHLEARDMRLFVGCRGNMQTLPSLRSLSCEQYSLLNNILKRDLAVHEIKQVCHNCSIR